MNVIKFVYFSSNIYRLVSYQQRKIGVDAVSLEMMRQLSDWEKKLLETQELLQVRGKVT